MTKTALALAANLLAAPALAAPPPAPRPDPSAEARIPFAHFGGVRNFEADGTDAVYLQDRGRRWYHAELAGPCRELPWAFGIWIDTRGSATFDRFSSLIVGHDRCQLLSLTRSAGPPPRKHKGHRPN
jgi:Family of unknown function (DUF6491)